MQLFLLSTFIYFVFINVISFIYFFLRNIVTQTKNAFKRKVLWLYIRYSYASTPKVVIQAGLFRFWFWLKFDKISGLI